MLHVNLRKLPQGAFRRGDNGSTQFYEVHFDLVLTFGGEIQVKVMYEGAVIESGSSRYY
jgi:hypothetical protein